MINIHKNYTLLAFLGTIFINPAFGATISVEDKINQQLIQMESPAEDILEELNDPISLKRHYKTISNAMIKLNTLNSNRELNDGLSKNIAIQNSWFSLISILEILPTSSPSIWPAHGPSGLYSRASTPPYAISRAGPMWKTSSPPRWWDYAVRGTAMVEPAAARHGDINSFPAQYRFPA